MVTCSACVALLRLSFLSQAHIQYYVCSHATWGRYTSAHSECQKKKPTAQCATPVRTHSVAKRMCKDHTMSSRYVPSTLWQSLLRCGPALRIFTSSLLAKKSHEASVSFWCEHTTKGTTASNCEPYRTNVSFLMAEKQMNAAPSQCVHMTEQMRGNSFSKSRTNSTKMFHISLEHPAVWQAENKIIARI